MTKIFWIDLFSGAGGTSNGIKRAGAEVVACINHDENAIKSHALNHPESNHFIEDVRDMNVMIKVERLVVWLRHLHPGCIVNIWSSLECTNYSKAKGGLPRDADSRTLAYAMYEYVKRIKPDYVYIENVREFMAWGPLDENGRPISKRNGSDYIKWVNRMIELGSFNFDFRLLNSADYGAYTSRERYFGQFARKGMPIHWPEQTHCKNPNQGGMFENLKRWKPVKDVLDLLDEGKSIFTRKKELSENTLKRIYAGLIKFVAGGEEAFLKKYFSGTPSGKVLSLTNPAGAITTVDHHAYVKPVFLQQYHGGNLKDKVYSANRPARVITTWGNQTIVKPVFLTSYYGNSKSAQSGSNPSPTITTKDRLSVVHPKFFTSYYSGGGQLSSLENPSPTLTGIPKQRLTSVAFIDQQYGQSKPKSLSAPASTVTANPKLNLVRVSPWLMNTNYNNIGHSLEKPSPVITANRKHHYLMNPQFNDKGRSLDKPCFTLIARMDKKPPYLLSTLTGRSVIIINKTDSETMLKIKEFMALYGIIDIKMRMLKIPELLQIQGFPKDYQLIGTKTEQKKYIGNAVEGYMATAIAKANLTGIMELLKVA